MIETDEEGLYKSDLIRSLKLGPPLKSEATRDAEAETAFARRADCHFRHRFGGFGPLLKNLQEEKLSEPARSRSWGLSDGKELSTLC